VVKVVTRDELGDDVVTLLEVETEAEVVSPCVAFVVANFDVVGCWVVKVVTRDELGDDVVTLMEVEAEDEVVIPSGTVVLRWTVVVSRFVLAFAEVELVYDAATEVVWATVEATEDVVGTRGTETVVWPVELLETSVKSEEIDTEEVPTTDVTETDNPS
jgi:hypothetical protein